jgi:hypothetical protein
VDVLCDGAIRDPGVFGLLTPGFQKLSRLDRDTLAGVERQLVTGLTGQPLSASVAGRHRKVAHACIRRAAEQEVIPSDPWPPAPRGRSRRKAVRKRRSVDTHLLPDPATRARIIQAIRSHQPGSRTYQVMTAASYYAGLRPSEVVMLRPRVLELPATGWGRAHVVEADIDWDEPGERRRCMLCSTRWTRRIRRAFEREENRRHFRGSARPAGPTGGLSLNSACALLAALILERHSKLRSVGERVPIAEVEILLDHLGNSEITQALPSELHGAGSSILPRVCAGADQLDHFVDSHENISSSEYPRSSTRAPVCCCSRLFAGTITVEWQTRTLPTCRSPRRPGAIADVDRSGRYGALSAGRESRLLAIASATYRDLPALSPYRE